MVEILQFNTWKVSYPFFVQKSPLYKVDLVAKGAGIELPLLFSATDSSF